MLLSNGSIIPAQADTLADRSPMRAQRNYYSNGGLALSGTYAEYSEIYKRQLWVGILIRKLAMGTARMPLEFRQPKGTSFTIEDGPLAQLMRKPNPNMSGFQLKRWVSATSDIYGEAFVWKMRDSKKVVRELHPVHPRNVVPHYDDDLGLVYLYTAGIATAPQMIIPAADMLRFTSYNPENITRGLSNLEGLRMTLLNDDASRRANASFWEKGARPSVILQVPTTLSDTAYARLKASWESTQAGADNAGNTALLEEGTTATVNALNLEELQYIDSRKLNRDETCSAFDVPPPAVHILDRATFSNITEQLRSMYRDTMATRFVEYESVIDDQLVPDFYPDSGIESKFNMDDVLRGDFETRATAVAPLISAGVFKPNEARPLFGLAPDDEAGDVLYGNAALVPLGSNARPAGQQVATDGTLIPTPVARSIAPVRPHTRPSVRSIMGRLSQVKDNKTATRAKLVSEHAKELGDFFGRQKAAVLDALSTKDASIFDPTEWDAELSGILLPLSTATTQAIGTKTASDLGGSYDPDRISDWLTTDADSSAKDINATTSTKLADRVKRGKENADYDQTSDVGDFFDEQIDSRSADIADSRVTMLAGFAALVAAEMSNAASKTWVVTSANARSSHAAMDGETVGLNESFSNGMNGPGDFSGGADEVAGCTCELTFTLPNN